MSIKERTNKLNKKKLLARFIIASYIIAGCIWVFCLMVIISGSGKGEIGYFLAVGFFIAWPVLSLFLILFLRIFLPMIKK